jgi:hypothetical protein
MQTIVSMPFDENTYVVWLKGRSEALVVDPGLEPLLILEFLRSRLRPAVTSTRSTCRRHRRQRGSRGFSQRRPSYQRRPLLTDASLTQRPSRL